MCYTYKWRRLLVKETLIPPLQCWRIATALLFSVVIISIAHQCGKVKADEKFSFGVISAWLFFVHIFKMRPRSTAAAMGHIVYYAEKIIFLIWIHLIKPFGYIQRYNKFQLIVIHSGLIIVKNKLIWKRNRQFLRLRVKCLEKQNEMKCSER